MHHHDRSITRLHAVATCGIPLGAKSANAQLLLRIVMPLLWVVSVKGSVVMAERDPQPTSGTSHVFSCYRLVYLL